MDTQRAANHSHCIAASTREVIELAQQAEKGIGT